MRMEVDQCHTILQAPAVIQAVLSEFSAITDYRILRDSLPRRLAHILCCRCVLLYQRIGETLQFAAGTFDDKPGWSAALLSVVHINPIQVQSTIPEAQAVRERRTLVFPNISATTIIAPLLYRQRATGVLVAIRGQYTDKATSYPSYWHESEAAVVEAVAGIAALLLENTRLLERDRGRIQELSLLNAISRQMNFSLYEVDRLRAIVVQRVGEISTAEQTALVELTDTSGLPLWITPALHEAIVQHFHTQKTRNAFVMERSASNQDALTLICQEQLTEKTKTFFVLPLVSGRVLNQQKDALQGTHEAMQEPRVLGYIAGTCYRAWKLRREEVLLLQVLAGHASAVLENIILVAEVLEARNEARKLLRQVLADMTTMYRLEEEKRRLDRLASLGEMAANVAHEVRNPLASIKTSVQILLDDLEHEKDAVSYMHMEDQEQSAINNEEIRESMAVILHEVERLDTIVRDLLSFARPRQLHRVKSDIQAISEHVLHIMQTQCAEAHVQVRRVYEALPSLWVDVAQIEQILFNLYTNALQAMPDGGTMTIAHQLIEASLSTYDSLPTLVKQCLEIAIIDTGVGIAPEQLEHIFQPFFTTKAHGMGLGLSITRRLVEDHGGSIHIESTPGRGTTVFVRLPLLTLREALQES